MAAKQNYQFIEIILISLLRNLGQILNVTINHKVELKE